MKIVLDKTKGAIMPSRAHEFDGGLDLYSPKTITVPGCKFNAAPYFGGYGKVYIGQATIDTGVHVQIPEGYVGFIKSKSGLMVNSGLYADGTIDSGYSGSVRVVLINTKANDYIFKAGDKIAQLVIQPCALPQLEVVDALEETERGENGFGSTGR